MRKWNFSVFTSIGFTIGLFLASVTPLIAQGDVSVPPPPLSAKQSTPTSKPSSFICRCVGLDSSVASDSIRTVELSGSETQIDMGYVKPDSRHRLLLRVANPSSEKSLPLRKFKSECKCMTFEASPCEIPAGESVDLPIAIHFGEKETPYAKRVILFTDDAQNPMIACLVKADVGLPLTTIPQDLDLGVLSPGEHQAEILLYNRGEMPVKPLYCTADTPNCLGLIPRAEISENEKLSIPVKMTVEGNGTQTTTVTIHTNCPAQRQVRFMVRYTVASDPQAADPTPPEGNSR